MKWLTTENVHVSTKVSGAFDTLQMYRTSISEPLEVSWRHPVTGTGDAFLCREKIDITSCSTATKGKDQNEKMPILKISCSCVSMESHKSVHLQRNVLSTWSCEKLHAQFGHQRSTVFMGTTNKGLYTRQLGLREHSVVTWYFNRTGFWRKPNCVAFTDALNGHISSHLY